ncbi:MULTISPECIES: glycosyltransferase family 2 protein [Citricoccus]|uniref:glycosyltransferase family 2 protein n=1 Tax=Citricoccus TaxID=169133 RepID=UPI000255F60C|nr:glycosyltransferase family 2 protein [Citricoccus sp. CH26A]
MTAGDHDVTVVIPARNDAVLLDRCLRALARQTREPAEVIVVDNASTDATGEVARAHGATVVEEERIGIWAAAAAGYDAASSPVIARLDADSVPPADWVQKVAAGLQRRPSAVALTGWGVFEDLPRPVGAPVAALYLGAYYVLGHAAAAGPVLWGSNMALRRTAWHEVRDRVHRWEREVHDDMDLALALGPRQSVSFDPRLVVGVSARSLKGASQLVRRVRRARRTLELNFREAQPWERWAERLRAAPSPR